MQPIAPTLPELQRALRASLVGHDDGEAGRHVLADGMNPIHRIDVYRNTFASVLVNALRLSFPAVQRLVGAEFFEGAARIFIGAHPPQSACLDEFGGEFPAFLGQFEPAASLRYLSDAARLDWAVHCSLHAQDAVPLDASVLAQIDGAERARVCFVAHPALRLLRVEYPVDLIWRGVLEEDDAALASIELTQGPIWLLVQRLESGAELRRMSESAWQFTARLVAGAPLHMALEGAEDFDLPALLAEHLSCGRFIGFKLADAA